MPTTTSNVRLSNASDANKEVLVEIATDIMVPVEIRRRERELSNRGREVLNAQGMLKDAWESSIRNREKEKIESHFPEDNPETYERPMRNFWYNNNAIGGVLGACRRENETIGLPRLEPRERTETHSNPKHTTELELEEEENKILVYPENTPMRHEALSKYLLDDRIVYAIKVYSINLRRLFYKPKWYWEVDFFGVSPETPKKIAKLAMKDLMKVVQVQAEKDGIPIYVESDFRYVTLYKLQGFTTIRGPNDDDWGVYLQWHPKTYDEPLSDWSDDEENDCKDE
ncbi:hypothetical protein GGR57DRAFT_280791 [Xylariaceae sp. FL1272]|nr:hypothetical protein GGR57DRAFT_280791 [Xylariaceae sp. FL1272]